MLTRRLQPKIGKPGQASAPVGKRLNAAANLCVNVVLEKCQIATATHVTRIDQKAIVEAFPTAFMGVMLRDPRSLPTSRNNRSDIFFQHLIATDALEYLITCLLPGRSLVDRLDAITNHDDRAALVCALTALSVAAGDYTAVGDSDGWIILPPHRFVRSWARVDLEANAKDDHKPEYYYRSAGRPR